MMASPPSAAQMNVKLIQEIISKNQVKKLKDLLNNAIKGDSLIDSFDGNTSNRRTFLHIAASKGFYEICKILLSHGASVDLQDQDGETALLKASYHGHSDIVDLLLANNANPNLLDNDGWSVLHNAASSGKGKVVRNFIRIGMNPDCCSKTGKTPLMNAASKGYTNIVGYLLKKGANPCLQDVYGEYAYDMAASMLHYEVCVMLQEAEIRWCLAVKLFKQPSNKSLMEAFEQINTVFLDDIIGHIMALETRRIVQLPKHSVELEVLYENQRSSTFLSKFSASNLHPLYDTCGPWSDRWGNPSKTKSDDFMRPPVNWFWLSNWTLDCEGLICDENGWQYANSWKQDLKPSTVHNVSSLKNLKPLDIVNLRIPNFLFLQCKWQATVPTSFLRSVVRRRRYLRARKLIPSHGSPCQVPENERFWPSICDPVYDSYFSIGQQTLRNSPPLKSYTPALDLISNALDILYPYEYRYLEKSGTVEVLGYQAKAEVQLRRDSSLVDQKTRLEDYEKGISMLLHAFKDERDKDRKQVLSDFVDRLLSKLEKINGTSSANDVTVDNNNNNNESEEGVSGSSSRAQNITFATMESFKPLSSVVSSGPNTDANVTPTPGMFSPTPMTRNSPRKNSDLILSQESVDQLVENLERVTANETLEQDKQQDEKCKNDSANLNNSNTGFTNSILNPMYTMSISALSAEPSMDVYQFHDCETSFVDNEGRQERMLIRQGSSRLFQEALEGKMTDTEPGVEPLTEIEELIVQKRKLGWAQNETSNYCEKCQRKFGSLMLRRHHCRWCGQIFCDGCSRGRVTGLSPHLERVCVTCFGLWKLSGYMIDSSTPTSDKLYGHVLLDKVTAVKDGGYGGGGKRRLNLLSGIVNDAAASVEDKVSQNIGSDHDITTLIRPETSMSSLGLALSEPHLLATNTCPPDQPDLTTECPICAFRFAETATDEQVERHIDACVQNATSKNGSSIRPTGNRYLIRTLAEGIPEKECEICFETFDKGDVIAVLNCLCQFHEDCIAQWFFRGRLECPIHQSQ